MVVPALQGIEAVFHHQAGAILPLPLFFGKSPNRQQGEDKKEKR